MLLKLSLTTLLLVAVCIDSTNSQADVLACALKMTTKITECTSKVNVNTASFEVNEANCCAVANVNKCTKDALLSDAECKDKLGSTIADMEKAFNDKGCGQFMCTTDSNAALKCELKLKSHIDECTATEKKKLNSTLTSTEFNEEICCAMVSVNKCTKDAILGDTECKDKVEKQLESMEKAINAKGCDKFNCTSGAASTTATIVLTLTACLIGVWFAKN